MCSFLGRLWAGSLLFCLLAFPASGQIAGVVESRSSRLSVSAPGCQASGQSEPPDQIQPYTAELKTTTVQVLANGTTITHVSTEIRASDSEHRSYNSSTQPQFSADQPAFTWASVDDPVENTESNWNSQSKTAQVIKLPPEAERHGCWASGSGNMRMDYGPESPADREAARARMKAGTEQRSGSVPASTFTRIASEPKMEDLGTTTIEGVEAHGQRWTTVIPVGQIGNDRELTRTNESWSAPSLGFPIRVINDDPQGGRSTTEVTRIDLSEPPLSTFQPPEGYEVTVDELHQVPCETRPVSGFASGISTVSGTVP